MEDELIGKYAYKKRGFFSDLIGKIEKNDKGISKYKLVTKMGTTIGFNRKDEIVLVDIDE
jgi:hypothetical protein